MNESDPEFDEAELREAEALARALERGSADEELPEDALQSAALIRYGAGGGVLREEREDAILEEVLAAADRVRARPKAAAVPWWRWLFGAAGLAAVTALLLVILTSGEAGAPTALPSPDARLIEAQLARIEDRSADARFDEAMQSYRGDVYAALERRYGAR